MHCLVIPPEVVMEVEARMKRNYMPPMLPQRKHSRHAVKPHLPTVQELQGLCFFFVVFFYLLYFLHHFGNAARFDAQLSRAMRSC
jgi:hypothetical protein